MSTNAIWAGLPGGITIAQWRWVAPLLPHPFWSVDRNAWVSAIELAIGERLKTLTGTTVVQSRSKREEPETVYNLEVEGDHCYRVGESGILVHNASAPVSCCDPSEGFQRSLGTTPVTVSWFSGSIDRADGVVALVTADSIGTGDEFDRGSMNPVWWSELRSQFSTTAPDRWERGHLIGNQLGGPGRQSWWNMVPLHRAANNDVMKPYENQIRRAAERGECIDVTVTPTYGNRKVIPLFVKIVATSQNSDFSVSANVPNRA